ncbi:MaoC family dehydratase [Rhodococcus antarcticus]|jgi:acyl dehydratase|uniref:MaoC family dehydratase n=1 Tax=Rhodococcus antarcticus TaxID=2987751 RepID=A0ABY6P1X7_9NOCA|nr:MaoC family dehydratase [Rhodococcus antarcticus]UZJ25655.1 MaoC family dehydratase [Rhodococcus antarcticus]
MRTFTSPAELLAAQGETLGTSDWVEVTQERINTFAEATGDHQWIHVDVERAKAESPFGGPIAHGFLTLSLLPMLSWQIWTVEGTKMGVNYGLNKVRFPSPVPVGSMVRSTAVLTEVTEVGGGGLQLVVSSTVEVEGGSKPVCVAEMVSRLYF